MDLRAVALNAATVVYPASDTTANTTPNSIAFAGADSFTTGEKVAYISNLGAADTSGLTSGSTYYMDIIDAETIQLSTTPDGDNVVSLGANPLGRRHQPAGTFRLHDHRRRRRHG